MKPSKGAWLILSIWITRACVADKAVTSNETISMGPDTIEEIIDLDIKVTSDTDSFEKATLQTDDKKIGKVFGTTKGDLASDLSDEAASHGNSTNPIPKSDLLDDADESSSKAASTTDSPASQESHSSNGGNGNAMVDSWGEEVVKLAIKEAERATTRDHVVIDAEVDVATAFVSEEQTLWETDDSTLINQTKTKEEVAVNVHDASIDYLLIVSSSDSDEMMSTSTDASIPGTKGNEASAEKESSNMSEESAKWSTNEDEIVSTRDDATIESVAGVISERTESYDITLDNPSTEEASTTDDQVIVKDLRGSQKVEEALANVEETIKTSASNTTAGTGRDEANMGEERSTGKEDTLGKEFLEQNTDQLESTGSEGQDARDDLLSTEAATRPSEVDVDDEEKKSSQKRINATNHNKSQIRSAADASDNVDDMELGHTNEIDEPHSAELDGGNDDISKIPPVIDDTSEQRDKGQTKEIREAVVLARPDKSASDETKELNLGNGFLTDLLQKVNKPPGDSVLQFLAATAGDIDAAKPETGAPLDNGDALQYGYTTIWGRRRDFVLDKVRMDQIFENIASMDSNEGSVPDSDSSTLETAQDLDALKIADGNSSTDNSTRLPKSVNTEFVEGLDDIDKFLEEVDPPDELDVGAAGSSMQEVLIGQGARIVLKRVLMVLSRIMSSLHVTRVKEFVATRRNSKGHFALVKREEMQSALRNLKAFWEGLFDDIDGASLKFEMDLHREESKLDSIRQRFLRKDTETAARFESI